nr:flagellar M-ring protein FliF [Burkholderiaceae bacterium]
MDTTIDNATAQPAPTGFAALPVKHMALLGIGLAALAAIAVASVMWARTPDYKVLFANLSDKDGGSVVASLSQMNVPYKYAEGGGAILVPAAQVHDARLKLASQGLPRGGTVGFELMENQRFGITQFQERLNFQRGLEGELARSIQALPVVQGARVHLALPAQNGFMRDQQKPSASVLLNLHPGRMLDRAQVAGIVHLVASSIPDLSPKQVSIIDQTGALLSANGESAATGLDPGQLNYIRQVESGHIARILAILEPIYGRDNVRAQVSADVDFTQSEQTAEQFKPNQGTEPAAVRSMQTLEAKDANGAATQGVPGAMSNQPPVAATAPANAAAQNPQAAGQPGAQAGAPGRKEATTNFEVDKTVRVTRAGSGIVKRLTAAVVVNHKKVTAADGKVTYVALQAPEIENVNA